MSKSNPLLRYGSRGEDVKALQTILNVWLTTLYAYDFANRLIVDGIFGPKTHKAVTQFQTIQKLVVDGLVGQYTWAALSVYSELIQSDEVTPDEQAFGKRVAIMAEMEWMWYGFPRGQDVVKSLYDKSYRNTPPGVQLLHDPRIAAGMCERVSEAWKTDANFWKKSHLHVKPRQGGKRYQFILQKAGWPHWQGKNQITRNEEIACWSQTPQNLNWCGIFCYYLYRSAGLDLGGGWPVGHGPNACLKNGILRKVSGENIFPGCMGAEHEHNNHFFMVIRRNGNNISCIDGNAANTKGTRNVPPYLSIITNRERVITKDGPNKNWFYFPNLKFKAKK